MVILEIKEYLVLLQVFTSFYPFQQIINGLKTSAGDDLTVLGLKISMEPTQFLLASTVGSLLMRVCNSMT